MTNWERDRQIRARLSAIEVTKGIGDEWYEQRERLYNFQFETGVYSRTTEGADTESNTERMHSESDGDHRCPLGSVISIVTRRRIGDT